MKKLIFLIAIILFTEGTNAQYKIDENFDYTAGDYLDAHGWTGNTGGATNRILITTPGLTYAGYPLSNIGNAVTLHNTGQDAYIDFATIADSSNTNSVYASCLVKVTAAQSQGDYFLAFLQTGSTTIYEGRLFARIAYGIVNFGITKANSTTDTSVARMWTEAYYTTGRTYLIVLKYTFIEGSYNDAVSLFVFDSGIPSSEPIPTIGPISFTSVDAKGGIGRIALRQGGATRAPDVIVDGIRISTSWSSIISFMNRPQLLHPANNSVNNPATNTFTWKKLTSVYKYRVQIATDSIMSNVVADSSVFGDTSLILSEFNYAVKYYWKVTAYDIFNNYKSSATWNFTVLEIPSLKLKLTAVIEGMYYPLFNIVSRRDTFTVELRENVSPYNLVASKKGVLDSLNFTSLVQFPNGTQGTYYIVFKHINSIVTWSKSGGETFNYNDTVNCNFTSAASQAYGNNLELKGSKYCIISGDVDRDGYIDASDASPIDNDSYISRTGRFLPTDLNGDNFVDADDMNIQDNNRNRGVIQP